MKFQTSGILTLGWLGPLCAEHRLGRESDPVMPKPKEKMLLCAAIVWGAQVKVAFWHDAWLRPRPICICKEGAIKYPRKAIKCSFPSLYVSTLALVVALWGSLVLGGHRVPAGWTSSLMTTWVLLSFVAFEHVLFGVMFRALVVIIKELCPC